MPDSVERDVWAEQVRLQKTPEEWELHWKVMKAPASRETLESTGVEPGFARRYKKYQKSMGEITFCREQRWCVCGRYQRLIDGEIVIIKGMRERLRYPKL